MRLIFLGSPGVGKGTQAKRLSREYHLTHIATGELLRAAILKGEESGLAAKAHLEAGRLVPNDLIIRVLKERIEKEETKNGFILDGFPRNREQADFLSNREDPLPIDRVLYFYLNEEALAERLMGRQHCPLCQEIYHRILHPPKKEGTCDTCGASLILRKDDRMESVVERLRVYKNETAPLVQYYQEKGCLISVDAEGSMEEVAGRVRQAAGLF